MTGTGKVWWYGVVCAAMFVQAGRPHYGFCQEPPLVGRPANFSHVVGKYRIAAEAQPTEVFVEAAIVLKVRIVGEGPANYRPERGRLQIFPSDFADQFHVEPVPDQDSVPAENVWQFVYRLRPKSTEVAEVPALGLVYYAANRRGYTTTFSDPIALVVTAKPPEEPTKPLVVLQAAKQLYHLVRGESVLVRQETIFLETTPVLLVLGLGLPLAVVVGFFCWRRLYPNKIEQLHRHRSQAARQALRELHALEGKPNSQQAVEVLIGYLRHRFDFPVTEPTPEELGRFLRRRGVRNAAVRQWIEFLETSDEARFAPAAFDVGELWAERAVRLITDLETDPSLTRPTLSRMRFSVRSAGDWLMLSRKRAITISVGCILLVSFVPTCPLLVDMPMGIVGDNAAQQVLERAEWNFTKGVWEKQYDTKEARLFFQAAANAYAELHESGIRNAALFLNWGNAELLAGNVAPAILAYHRGLRLAPAHADLLANLALACERVDYPNGRGRPESASWLWQPSRGLLLAGAAVFYIAACLLVSRWLLVRRGILLGQAVVCLLLAATWALFWHRAESAMRLDVEQPLVVVAQESGFYRGNGILYPVQPQLPTLQPGMEGRRLFQRGDWLQIQVPGGIIGWVLRASTLVDE